ncbi:hypothetical protein [Catenuloplanes atrovinosus]|uniref:Uncharacterized protein n=1 Tax=Catenuloplanes atrovinosus TaxID=137266 RepID=A0AAE3YQE3_9ACTN|nr:hypothetical protein [Catenuloplanes atrovinosus]MDR7276498.1 hypothetical protein [Catenuloplanes atrovinosus]
MFQAGVRSRQVGTFMLAEDEVAFGERLAPAIAELGRWETHDRHARTVTLHDSLPDAMRRSRGQAFLRPRGEDGDPVGPLIQYLRSTTLADEPGTMRPGRLALRWFPDDHADGVRRDFAHLADAAWQALREVTSAHVETDAGEPARRYRIGAAATAWALAHPDRRLHDGGRALRVRATHPVR